MRKSFRGAALALCMVPLLHAYADGAAPKPIFELPFDGSAEAAAAGGKAQPLKAENISFTDGLKGKAVSIAKNSFLEYATEGNLNQERGSVTLWFKPNWRVADMSGDKREEWHCLFSEPFPKDGQPGKDSRHGSGALWLWFWGPIFRGDISDINDKYVTAGSQGLDQTKWAHIAFTWDVDKGSRLYMNGIPVGNSSDGDSPLNVKTSGNYSALKNKFASFFVGSQEREAKADGSIDEFRIYPKALTLEEIAADMALTSTFRLECATPYCMAGGQTEIRWSLKNLSRQDAPCAFSWRIEDALGSQLASGKEQAAPVKPGEGTKPFSAKLKSPVKGELKLVVETGSGPTLSAEIWALDQANPYLKAPGTKLETKLIATVDLVKDAPASRFAAIGSCVKGSLDGRSYLEAGSKKNDRFAVRVELPKGGVPYLIEWDYPDDKLRSIEMMAQESISAGSDYGLQTGVFCGREYPLSMKMITHRSILWARSKDTAFIFMTAKDGSPAALAEMRIYSIEGGLPDAGVKDAKPVGGWTRSVGIHFEDPAIGYDFGIENQLMPSYEKTLDRLIAYMKWSGQNILSYPAVWYHGRIGTSYQPRLHPDDFIACILSKFEVNGLGFMPAINLQNIKLPEGVSISQQTLSDGSLHSSPVMIFSNGKPNPGGWHGTPPNFNPLHPAVQGYVDAQIDDMLERYSGNPAFKGIVMHLTKHTIPWFGAIEAGYNDYNIDAFEKDTGIKVQADRNAPLRGKLYYDWLMANAKSEWLQWRCQKIADWYKAIAAKMAAKRPDLKLSLCSYNPTISDHGKDPRYMLPELASIINKESGLDPKLYDGIPNLILSQTLYPADYRYSEDWKGYDTARSVIVEDHFKPGVYSLLDKAAFPWINMHDRYFEDAVGREGKWYGGVGNPLKASWLREHGWRVSTLNPNINSFLEHYVLPLRYNDVLGFTKGGFLIGTCGVEEKLVEFSKAYRALPAKRFSDLPGSTATVKARTLTIDGETWAYAVNTEQKPASISLVFDKAPGSLSDLGEGKEIKAADAKLKLELKPYQLRSFKIPKGVAVKAAE